MAVITLLENVNIVVILLILALVLGLWYLRSGSAEVRYPPGPRDWPLFGSFLAIAFAGISEYELMTKWRQKYGDIFTLRIFNSRMYVLNTFDLIQEAFQHPDISDRLPFLALEDQMGRPNNGIIHSSGKTWREHRKFANHVLRNVGMGRDAYEGLVSKQARLFLQKLEDSEGQRFDPLELIKTSLANVITTVALGVQFDYEDPDLKKLIRLNHRLFELAGAGHLWILVPFVAKLPLVTREFRACLANVWNFLGEKLQIKRDTFNPEDEPSDFVHCYLKELYDNRKNGKINTFDDINLRESTFDIMAAGWDTAATAIAWQLLFLIRYPEVQARAQKEIDSAVGRDRFPTLSDSPNLPYTEATILEILRLCPITPMGVPHVVAADTVIGGYTFPKGSLVSGNFWAVCKDPLIWGDPKEFRPERFLDENGMLDKKQDLMTFGIGRRICLGERLARTEIFLFFTYTLQNFTLMKATESTELNMEGISSLTYCTHPYEIRAIKR